MAHGIKPTLESLIQLRYAARQLVKQWHRSGSQTAAGNHISHIKGRGMDFDEVRHYQAGDDIRLMDWKVTARTGRAHIKLYREEKERPVFMLVDQSQSMFFGTKLALKSVLAAEIAGLIGWKTILQHDRLSTIILEQDQSHFFPPTAREQGLLPVLKKLTEIVPRTPGPKSNNILTDGFEHLRKVVKPGAYIYIISDFLSFNQEALRHLSRLTQHASIFVCLIRDPLEMRLLPKASLNISDGNRQLCVNIKDAKLRQKIQESINLELELLQNVFRRHAIQFRIFEPSENALLGLKEALV